MSIMRHVLFWEQAVVWCFVEHYFRCSWAAVLQQWTGMQRMSLLFWNGEDQYSPDQALVGVIVMSCLLWMLMMT
jgi:hypothetical protein